MVNIGSFLTAFPVITGAVLLAVWAYHEISSHQERQQQRQRYEQRPGQNGSNSRTNKCPPQPANDCIICKDELSAPLEILPCSHIYHRVCIREWFKLRVICPYCNSPMSDGQKEEYRQRLRITH